MGFGAGSLVFTGLQIGAEIASGPFRAITPGARLLLVTAQMHFIFLNSKSLNLAKHAALAKLGLMHMIATNLCEWLQVRGPMNKIETFVIARSKMFKQPDTLHSSCLFETRFKSETSLHQLHSRVIRVNLPVIVASCPTTFENVSMIINSNKGERTYQKQKMISL